jgi:hypothetical protein
MKVKIVNYLQTIQEITNTFEAQNIINLNNLVNLIWFHQSLDLIYWAFYREFNISLFMFVTQSLTDKGYEEKLESFGKAYKV